MEQVTTNLNLNELTKQDFESGTDEIICKIINRAVDDSLQKNDSDSLELARVFFLDHCAKVVGEIFGIEISILEYEEPAGIFGYSILTKEFSFTEKFRWISEYETPTDLYHQDIRLLELAKTKREEIITDLKIKENLNRWNSQYTNSYFTDCMNITKSPDYGMIVLKELFDEMARTVTWLNEQVVIL